MLISMFGSFRLAPQVCNLIAKPRLFGQRSCSYSEIALRQERERNSSNEAGMKEYTWCR